MKEPTWPSEEGKYSRSLKDMSIDELNAERWAIDRLFGADPRTKDPVAEARGEELWKELLRRALAGDQIAVVTVADEIADEFVTPDGKVSAENLQALLDGTIDDDAGAGIFTPPSHH